MIDATSSLSYSQILPMAPSETFTVETPFGTRFESGDILNSFYGN